MSAARRTRIVILGGGFAALATAKELEKRLPTEGAVEVSLVSRDNYLLFTPMLAELASGELQPHHICTPLRDFLHHVQVTQGEVVDVDLQRRVIAITQPALADTFELTYDQLVLALGSVVSFHHVPGAVEYVLPFKRLADGARIRDRTIDCFEQAVVEQDPARRRQLLTFVVVGGGFSGVELAAALGPFLRALINYYPRLAGERPQLELIHHGARLLEELDEAASRYTLNLLRRGGINVRLGTAVSRVAQDNVELDPGGVLATRSVFWTAGIAPSPVTAKLALPKDQHGAVIVDEYLRVQGQVGVWAVGDCAHVPNKRRGGSYAALAQVAERQGPVLAHNLLASLHGEPLRSFDYQLLGTFASLGHRSAVGQIRGHEFSGLLAWFMWRGIYLGKLPGLSRKLRVGLDWLLDCVFPPDIIETHPDISGINGKLQFAPPSGPPQAAPGGTSPTPSPQAVDQLSESRSATGTAPVTGAGEDTAN